MDERAKSVSDWQLERLAQGELDPAAAGAIEDKLGQAQTRQRLDEIEASNHAILDKLPPQAVSAAIRRRLEERRAPRGRVLMAALLPFALAAGVWAVAVAPQVASVPTEGGYEGVKGTASLRAYRVHKDIANERLGDAARVRPHDTIQLSYAAGESDRFGVVISVDGRGVITQHLPVNATAPASLAAARETSLPRSFELDDTPGFERFFFVTAAKPFSLNQVLEAARALAGRTEARRQPLSLPAGLFQTSLLLEKVQP